MQPSRLATAVAAALVLVPAAQARPLAEAPGCPLFPAASPWNQRVDRLPLATGSAALVRAMHIPHLHPDFGTVYGIPYNVATAATPRVRVSFDYADESDRGPYPIPASPKIEDGSDRHLLVIERSSCTLYELFAASRSSSGWRAGSGAIWKLSSLALRPAGWTSADAAGLPILPGLARRSELDDGGIDHALRMTVDESQAAYLWPARHLASAHHDPALAPMGLRVRLRKSFPIGGFGPQTRAVLQALKTYGLIVADNGSSGYLTGAVDRRWDDDDLHALHQVPASALEVVDVSYLPGAPRARLWNPRTRIVGSKATVRAFLTGRASIRIVAVKGGRTVAAGPVVRLRGGLVTRSMHTRAGARYTLRIVA